MICGKTAQAITLRPMQPSHRRSRATNRRGDDCKEGPSIRTIEGRWSSISPPFVSKRHVLQLSPKRCRWGQGRDPTLSSCHRRCRAPQRSPRFRAPPRGTWRRRGGGRMASLSGQGVSCKMYAPPSLATLSAHLFFTCMVWLVNCMPAHANTYSKSDRWPLWATYASSRNVFLII